MHRHKFHEIEWLEFDLLSDLPLIKHAVFLRHGGQSEGSFTSLNTSFNVGDKREHVEANLKLLEKQLQTEVPNWQRVVFGQGNHGKTIALVDDQSPQEIENVDGVATATSGVSLMMRHADCQVALFYDPIHHAATNVHCGWRGSVLNIYSESVRYMHNLFGSNPADLLVCISPSLGPDEAEFMHYRSELPEEFWHFQVRPTYFDFWAISEHQLQMAGILPHHIEVARLSTYSNSYDFFSYRRDKITGRHATCITLL